MRIIVDILAVIGAWILLSVGFSAAWSFLRRRGVEIVKGGGRVGELDTPGVLYSGAPDHEAENQRVCPGLPGNPPCGEQADVGDRYCAACRAEFDARPAERGW